MTKWTQTTIHAWAIETFGQTSLNTISVAIRMAKETTELCYCLRNECPEEEVFVETADVAIMLYQVANCLSVDLGFEITSGNLRSLFEETYDKTPDSDIAADEIQITVINLISALHHGTLDEARRQVVILSALLAVIEEVFEFDLDIQIQNKMEINSKRTWGVGLDGSRQHV